MTTITIHLHNGEQLLLVGEDAHSKMINISKSVGFVNGAIWMRDKFIKAHQ
jgi:hypothetical protein